MKKLDKNGQISAEAILILATISMIILITANYTTNYLNEITKHSKTLLNTTRKTVLTQI